MESDRIEYFNEKISRKKKDKIINLLTSEFDEKLEIFNKDTLRIVILLKSFSIHESLLVK